MAVVRKFVHLLDQSDQDFQEELELMKLREEVVTLIRSNQQQENDLNLMDIKIGLLVKNKITLQVGYVLLGGYLRIELSPMVNTAWRAPGLECSCSGPVENIAPDLKILLPVCSLHSANLVCIPRRKSVGGEETRPEAKKGTHASDCPDLMNTTDCVSACF